MREESLLYWGMVVTGFLLIAAMITARDLFEMYLERRSEEAEKRRGEQMGGYRQANKRVPPASR